MANRSQQNPPVVDSFHQFSKLVDEIRLMIWEYTWPASRLIEASLFDVPESREDETDDDDEVVNLRLAGGLSTMLRLDLGSRVTEERPVEQCPAPVALQICRQSRLHTLTQYRVMTSLAGPFYYSPQRDVIWFSVDVADDYPIHMPILEQYHGTELNTFETILVHDSEWPESPMGTRSSPRAMDYTLDCISHLGGLKTIQILWGDSDFGSKQSIELDEEGEENGPQARADHLRSNFAAIIEHERCTATKIEVIDRDGNLY